MSTNVNNAVSSNTAGNGVKYFDLHTTGVGYLNRAREVTLKKGSFLAVDVSALRGSADAVEYTRFDCRVSGEEAQAVVRKLQPDIDAKKKVIVGFKLGDQYAEPFVYESGEKKGQTGVSLKARLLFIQWAKVDGVTVYQAPRQDEPEPDASSVAPFEESAAA